MSREEWDTDPGVIAANKLNPQAQVTALTARVAELEAALNMLIVTVETKAPTHLGEIYGPMGTACKLARTALAKCAP